MPARTHTYCPNSVSSLFTVHSSPAAHYSFSAKERDAETGLSYFGARYYSSDLSIWLSVDPMSDKYPSLSPYVYCADNPVKLVDPNGEEIVGTDGKAVTYSYDKDNNVVWSANASDDTKRIGNALLKTETGKEQLDFMTSTNTKVKLEIDKGQSGNAFGQMKPGKALKDNNGSIVLKTATIKIFEGTITNYLTPDNKTESPNILNDMSNMGFKTREAAPSIDEYIGAVACHEIEHIKPENFKFNLAKDKHECERMPENKKWNILLS